MNSRVTTILGGLAALSTLAAPASARGDCAAARRAEAAGALPQPWRNAVDALLRSAAEGGHPWSCSGATIALELGAEGPFLRVERPGEAPILRRLADPADVVPLGQALLAAPLPSATPLDGASASATPAGPGSPVDSSGPAPAPPTAPDVGSATPVARNGSSGTGAPMKKDPRLLVGGGFDGRAVGGSGVAWTGILLNASVPLGRWLPTLSLRQQSAFFSDGPSIDELSVAVAVQYRVPLRAVELRAGVVARGGAVLRDLPRPQGEQSQLQGRLGGVLSLSVPVVRQASFLVWADGDGVVVSRETTEPTASSTGATPKPFPSFTVGGGVGVEVAL